MSRGESIPVSGEATRSGQSYRRGAQKSHADAQKHLVHLHVKQKTPYI